MNNTCGVTFACVSHNLSFLLSHAIPPTLVQDDRFRPAGVDPIQELIE